MFPLTVCPATCELCGSWLPQHESSCVRNGIHPSQWSLEGETSPISITCEDYLTENTITTTENDFLLQKQDECL